MPQRFLRKALRVADRFRAFRPGVAVAVEGHTLDAELPATLAEFSGAVAGAHAREISKQQAFRWQIPELVQRLLAKMQEHRHTLFLRKKLTVRFVQSTSSPFSNVISPWLPPRCQHNW